MEWNVPGFSAQDPLLYIVLLIINYIAFKLFGALFGRLSAVRSSVTRSEQRRSSHISQSLGRFSLSNSIKLLEFWMKSDICGSQQKFQAPVERK